MTDLEKIIATFNYFYGRVPFNSDASVAAAILTLAAILKDKPHD